LGADAWAAQCFDLSSMQSVQFADSSVFSCVPSVLLPRLLGEPMRLDIKSPIHIRGSGDTWPQEAVIGRNVGAGRVPLSAAWTARDQVTLQESSNVANWKWQIDGEVIEVSAIEVIAEAISQLSYRISPKASIAVIIPNDFRQQEQQQILDSCRKKKLTNVTLLWAPVAAALAWIDRYESSLNELYTKGKNQLLHVHLDWGATRFTELSIQKENKPKYCKWLPARARPRLNDLLAGFGWSLESGADANSCLNERWTSLLAGVGATSSHQIVMPSGRANLLKEVQDWNITSGDPAVHLKAFKNKLIDGSKKYAGVVITGDHVNFNFAGGLNFRSALRSFAPKLFEKSIIAPGVEGERQLARGGAIFAAHKGNGIVSYLDTLPELDLFVETHENFEWKNLLDTKNEYVAGGEKWELPEPIKGLSVRRGATSVRLVVSHEEYRGVREIEAQLTEAAQERQSAELWVSAVAAQGNAKLTLKLHSDEQNAKKEIFADWRRMKPIKDDKGQLVDKNKYLEDQPRAFPELMPRRNSLECWNRAEYRVEQLIAEVENAGAKLHSIGNAEGPLRFLNQAVQQKDPSQFPNDATAIGSNYDCPGSQQDLERFSDAMIKLSRFCVKNRSRGVSWTVRILGYISVDNSDFEDWLIRYLLKGNDEFAGGMQAVKHSFGLCARNAANIEIFFTHVFEKENRRIVENDLKAVSQILRYRHNASENLNADLAQKIFKRCTLEFEQELGKGGRSLRFRWSSLIIVYILRRRMYDSSFIDPDGHSAVSAKKLFEKAIEDCNSGRVRPLGGSVNVPAALRQMIEYIDKKGRGDILMSNEGKSGK